MNIFYLDPNPKTCAEMHVSKHVVKMIIEYAQLMSTAHRVLDGSPVLVRRTPTGRQSTSYHLDDNRDGVLYRATHINHPSAIWVRDNIENYNWLYDMWSHLLDEYTYRYGKIHATARLKDALFAAPYHIKDGEFFAPTPAMPPELKILAENPQPGRKYDSLKSYHNYYNVAKRGFASWKGQINSRPIPSWYTV